MDSGRGFSDEEYSYIGDKGDIGFIDPKDYDSLCSNKPGESEIVNISFPFRSSSGRPQSRILGETIFDSITLKNITNEPLDLWSVRLYDSKPENSFTLSIMKPPASDADVEDIQAFMEAATLEDRVLRTDEPLTIWLSCKPKEIGIHSTAVHFTVNEETIERLVVILVEDKISQSLSSSKPYRRATRKKQDVVDVHAENPTYVVGRRPSRASSRGYTHQLPQYRIPAHIRDKLNNREVPEAVSEGLSIKNYAAFFKVLLAMEEIKLEEDMRAYDMENVTMKRNRRNQLLSLEVPGLAEKRPSLVIGDCIYVKLASEDEVSNKPHQGYIHRVEAEEICLKFENKFQRSHRDSNLYNVQFSYSRTGMRWLYQAIEVAERLDELFLFPCGSFKSRQVQRKKLVPISGTLNEKQATAVEMIFSCMGGPPYIIHGPPGTGKTMTLIEAVLQIYRAKQRARMLICAPSNSAADHILDRLISQKAVRIKKNELFRLNAYTRPFEDVNPKHLEYCFYEDFLFSCPSLEELARYRIVISTYSSAARLYSEGLKKGHFMYFFLDEAGQASEPETMVPLSHLYTKNSVVVLAGDPLQLGPVVFSRDAERLGLGTSYMERLFECELYTSGDERFMTKLVHNYRTHEAILQLPSELFYQGELIACKDINTNFSSAWKDIIPNKEFPLLFVGVQGLDEREGSNPSWFNRTEASRVVKIIKDLVEDKGLNEEDIGVITPYKQQVNKIRDALGCLGRPNIKVGSVEQFQGQEREVIIISTVRSTVKHNEFDSLHYLGFLRNPRRFNVAATRAKSLLIVIGNPHIICKDPNWNKLLWYCVDNGSYEGCFLPAQTQHTVAQNLNYEAENNCQSSAGGNWGEEGDGWKPSGDPWEGGWVQDGDARQPSEQQTGGYCENEGEALQPYEDQGESREQENQEASGVPQGNEDDYYQPSDVPWE